MGGEAVQEDDTVLAHPRSETRIHSRVSERGVVRDARHRLAHPGHQQKAEGRDEEGNLPHERDHHQAGEGTSSEAAQQEPDHQGAQEAR